ncbi:exodeoxyribonuclease III [Salinibius halmophilus]|uniref:exodeoxyribonuclease III n=1 Tax=Salinibius halmophilus TaxID=1853216 RepID=UPI000E66CF12|nr:exodeoxyribonuclease III [Salinibius halmophilus]
MRLYSFNINGLRARPHQIEALGAQADIIALQEIKVDNDQFPHQVINDLGWQAANHGQKGHYGVANLSRQPALAVRKGFAWRGDDEQARLIETDHSTSQGTLTLINGYFPQGENRNHETKFPLKVQFYADLLERVKSMPDDALFAVVGDMNVAFQDSDIGIGEPNRKRWLSQGKCAFLPEEREWMQALLDAGLVDTFRLHHPSEDNLFSWFDYRSRGFQDDPKRGLRIDYVLASPALAKLCQGAGIDYQVRGMEKPSDHAPIWADFDLDL